jgi:hypothetical protein
MTTIAQCSSIDEALVLRSVLAGSGIAAFLPDELTANTYPPVLFANARGFRVQVEDEDAEPARRVLAAQERSVQ